MNNFLKKTMVILACVVVFAILHVYATEPVDELSDMCRVKELHGITSSLINERRATNARSVDFRKMDYIHLHPYFEETMNDARFALLREFNEILRDAIIIQNKVNGLNVTIGDVIIGFAEPDFILWDKFFIGLTNERYFELIDLVKDFTGIEKEMLYITIWEPIVSWDPISEYIEFDNFAGSDS